jgi:hypothetical protein
VIISFTEKLHAASFSERYEAIENFRVVLKHLFDRHACYRIGYFETALVAVNQAQNCLVGWKIAFARYFGQYLKIGLFVEIEVVASDVKAGVWLESERLMDLEVEGYRWHRYLLAFAKRL